MNDNLSRRGTTANGAMSEGALATILWCEWSWLPTRGANEAALFTVKESGQPQ